MPLSYFRRPLALATIGYILILAGLKHRGFFRVFAPRELMPYARRASVEVEAVVLSGFAPKRAGNRFWLEATRVGAVQARGVRLMAYLPRGDPDQEALRPGQRVRLRGRLRLPRWPRRPGEFDERAFLDEHRAAFVFSARGAKILRPSPWFWLPWAAAETAHRALSGYLHRRFDAETASLLEGFLLGAASPLRPKLHRAIQDAGAMHLLVPSGAKVVFVLAALAWLGLRSGLGPPGRLLAVAALGGFYVLVVGAGPPYTRAYFAALTMYACWLFDRESGSFQGFVLSALGTLLWDPRQLFSVGFQMSYLAVLGLLIALPRWRAPKAWGILRPACELVTASLVVQLMLWPVFARVFGRGSLVGVFSNVLLVPASAVVMGAGFLAWGCSFLPLRWPEALAAASAAGLVRAFVRCCAAFASLPYAAVRLSPMGPVRVAAFYGAVSSFLFLPQGLWGSSERILYNPFLVGRRRHCK